MKSILTLTLAFAVVASVSAAPSVAQETATTPKATAAKLSGEEAGSTCTSACSKGECPISAAMAALPKMTYKVGEESTCCSHSAKALAEKSEAPIQFVVAETSYTDKAKAMEALITATETQLTAFTTPSVCEKSGKTTIAGQTCGCKHQAAKNVELVKAAVESVNMSYKVGEETCNCPMKAKSLVAEGKEMKYVVAGEETCCEMTARLNVARAKYKAAVEALTKAQAAATPEAKAGTKS